MAMKKTLVALSAMLALAAPGLAACGSDDATDNGSQSAQENQGSGDASVTGVTVVRSGGLTGMRSTWKVTAESPRADAVFADAAGLAPADSRGGPASPPCCDMYTYNVTVTFSDGTSDSYTTFDGDNADHSLTDLVAAVMKMHPDSNSMG